MIHSNSCPTQELWQLRINTTATKAASLDQRLSELIHTLPTSKHPRCNAVHAMQGHTDVKSVPQDPSTLLPAQTAPDGSQGGPATRAHAHRCRCTPHTVAHKPPNQLLPVLPCGSFASDNQLKSLSRVDNVTNTLPCAASQLQAVTPLWIPLI